MAWRAAGDPRPLRPPTFASPDLCERALDAVAGDDGAVALVGAPRLKEFARQSALHHAGARHHDRRPDVVKVLHALRTTRLLQLATAGYSSLQLATAGSNGSEVSKHHTVSVSDFQRPKTRWLIFNAIPS